MEHKEFIKLCTSIFKQYGFEKKSSNYYRDFNNDIVVVFGLQKSSYGGHYYYIEYGFIFPTINKYMPYPKYHQANIRQDRIEIDGNCAIEYETVSDIAFQKRLITQLEEIIEIAMSGKNSILNYSILGNNRATLIQGYNTLPYLGVNMPGITVVPD